MHNSIMLCAMLLLGAIGIHGCSCPQTEHVVDEQEPLFVKRGYFYDTSLGITEGHLTADERSLSGRSVGFCQQNLGPFSYYDLREWSDNVDELYLVPHSTMSSRQLFAILRDLKIHTVIVSNYDAFSDNHLRAMLVGKNLRVVRLLGNLAVSRSAIQELVEAGIKVEIQ